MRWDEDGQAFIGRICIGRIRRDVPENWREEYPPLPPPKAGEEDDNMAFSRHWRELERERFAKQEAKPWNAFYITDADGSGNGLGPFATEAEAKAAMESEVRQAMKEVA